MPSNELPAPVGLASIRRLAGTVVIVPLVAWLFGSSWTWERRYEPVRAAYAGAESESPVEMQTYLVPEGSQLEQGIVFAAGHTLTFEVPPIRGPSRVEVQAFYRDVFVLAGSSDGTEFSPLWDVPAVRDRGMRTRLRDFDPPLEPLTHLRLISHGNLDGHRVAGLRVTYEVAVVGHLWLGLSLIAGWLLLVALCRVRPTREFAGRFLALWQRLDPWLATALVLLILLKLTAEVLAVLAVAAAVAAFIQVFRHYFARGPRIALLYVAFLYVLLFVFLPWAVGRTATGLTASLYDFTIDHRMRPDGREINSDGVRFRGEAEDLGEHEFVVLALGDSFTYGLKLDYAESYPYVLESVLTQGSCSSPVRVVNFGWASSSPLLSLRLLEQVGAKYRPDLVLYNLDMTDFNDDLRYERDLRAAGDLEVDHGTVVRDLLLAVSSSYPALDGIAEVWQRLWRSPAVDGELESDVPRDRFFATALSLGETWPDIERGVIKNLAQMHAYSDLQLGVPMALIVYPRAYQYSIRESPKNWERSRYRVLGPYVREPFRYFEEAEASLPYPVISLLPAFDQADDFPLFFEDDPHWNQDGARLAAGAVARELISRGLVPCMPTLTGSVD